MRHSGDGLMEEARKGGLHNMESIYHSTQPSKTGEGKGHRIDLCEQA